MEGLRGYILSVISAAFVLAILNTLVDKKGSAGMLLRLIGGLFLTFTLISPVIDLDFTGIFDYLEEFSESGSDAAVSGELMAREEYRTIIKDKLEAYILDKAKDLGLDLTVEVTLGDDDVPEEVIIRGVASPYGKARLQQMITQDLGIAKENQLWIGQQ